ncbi:hypothetical protein AX17_006505 [Amanita inopinata Kibby_2008]|nr:hypothetical protein AX17_006505 [Amanita inopinata Kibby_2008]
MRFTAVVVSAFLLVGNVIAASSDYGGDWLEARSDSDQPPMWERMKPKFPSGIEQCNKKYGLAREMTLEKCNEAHGWGWKRKNEDQCYKIEEALRDFSPYDNGKCMIDPVTDFDRKHGTRLGSSFQRAGSGYGSMY